MTNEKINAFDGCFTIIVNNADNEKNINKYNTVAPAVSNIFVISKLFKLTPPTNLRSKEVNKNNITEIETIRVMLPSILPI